MDIKLKPELGNKGKEIQIKAYNDELYPLPPEIYRMLLNVYSSNISNPDGIIGLDVFDYIINRRVYNEIYTVTSGQLGFGEGETIKDGVYTLELTINDQPFTKKFVSVYNLKNELQEVIEQNSYEIKEINEHSVEMQSDSSLGKTEQIRLAMNLYNEIEVAALLQDEVKINDKLFQLNRILKIIKQE